jgi:hypothetical protein
VTTWVEEPTGGRERGPVGLARAWAEVLLRPRRFFRNGVAPGDQAPGLVFAVFVTLAHVGLRFAADPGLAPVYQGRPVLSAVFALAVVALFFAPLSLHLVAAVQTLLLRPFVPDRAGVSETVQVIAYATAPAIFAAVPVPAVQLGAAAWGVGLLVLGLSEVHGTSVARAAVAAAVPALLVFGYGFGGVGALESLLGVGIGFDAARAAGG